MVQSCGFAHLAVRKTLQKPIWCNLVDSRHLAVKKLTVEEGEDLLDESDLLEDDLVQPEFVRVDVLGGLGLEFGAVSLDTTVTGRDGLSESVGKKAE